MLERENQDLAQDFLQKTKHILNFLNKHKDLSKEHYKQISGKDQFQFCLEEPIEQQAILLRAYYLKTEILAIKWLDDEDKYWSSLSKNLSQIFANLGINQLQKSIEQKVKTIKVLEKKLEISKQNGFQTTTSSQQLISDTFANISEINQSLQSAANANKNKSSIINQLSNLVSNSNDYEQNISNLKTAVNSSEGELEILREKVKALTNEIEFLKNLRSECETNGLSIDTDFIRSNAHKLTDEASRQSVMRQINQLRENNEQQRHFIVKLRNNMTTLEQEVSSRTDLSQEDIELKLMEIEHLESIIAEFEHCVYALESEVDLLHQQLKLLENSSNSPLIEESSSNSVEQELKQLKELFENSMQMYSEQSALTEFAMEAAKCNKIIELLVVLNNCFNALEVIAAFHIRTEITHDKSIPSGFLSSKEEKLLVQETRPTSGSTVKIGNKMYFWDNHISFIVGELPSNDERRAQLIESIVVLKNIIVSEIKRIESTLANDRQHKTILRLLSATQKELSDIDIQQQYQSMEYKNIIQSMCVQVDQIKELPNTTEETILLIENLKSESKVRTDILDNTGTLVSSGFTNLIDSLNKKLTKENIN
ncbi:hypothetical protein [Thalassotalea marina]|uniref:hypothetical protein n=1 Tax=Thalassotalea marina TaxID=1673741 RepID=UPI001E39894C|nr:hypothetical protein [Thalassotalea marina]